MALITGHTRFAGVIGWPIEHSRSPQLHNAAYAATGIDAVYVALPVAPERLAQALGAVRGFGMLGVNVTVPHKGAVVALCDALEPLAASVGAVNTIVPDGAGRLRGYNTDVGGFQDALAERGVAPGRALVLGAGGAARAVVLALREAGHVPSVVARDVDKGMTLLGLGAEEVFPWTADSLAAALPRARLVIDATSAALDPIVRAFDVPIPLALLTPDTLVCSLVYHADTPLLVAARQRGLATMDGGPMLLHQAARAFSLMTAKPAPLAAMRAVLTAATP